MALCDRWMISLATTQLPGCRQRKQWNPASANRLLHGWRIAVSWQLGTGCLMECVNDAFSIMNKKHYRVTKFRQ
jgi:hypothetical protein